MSIKVTIPAAIRATVGNQSTVEIDGGNVKQVMDNLTAKFPDLGKRIYEGGNTAGGKLVKSVNLLVNEEDMRFLDNWNTPLKAGDSLEIYLAISGG